MLPDPMRCSADSVSPATYLLISCEHGGNRVPVPCRHFFDDCRALLKSHRGFDRGALVMARTLATNFGAPMLSATVSRLLVDLSRSIGHRGLHMPTIATRSVSFRQEIIEGYYAPHRAESERLVKQGIAKGGRVIHISCHSFTDIPGGVARRADVGLLYDPARQNERDFCTHWNSSEVPKVSVSGLEVRRNFPYQGRNDAPQH